VPLSKSLDKIFNLATVLVAFGGIWIPAPI
jgi:hypothetical protein